MGKATHVETFEKPHHSIGRSLLPTPCTCEGGRLCSSENPAAQRPGNAIPGLHSTWVSERILVMARPWEEHVHQFQVVASFVQQGVGMVLNLQEVWEHATCGPGILASSGFSYDPQPFRSVRIGVSNVGWRDDGVPELDRMLDIMQIMEFVTTAEGRKVALHSHSGLGRTGTAVACFLVYSGLYDAGAAVAMVRRARPGSIKTPQQVIFVSIFQKYLEHLRCTFKLGSRPAAQHSGQTPTKPLISWAPESRPQITTAAGGTADVHQGQHDHVVLDLIPGPPGGPAPVQVQVDAVGVQTESFASGLVIVRAVAGRPRPKADEGAQAQPSDNQAPGPGTGTLQGGVGGRQQSAGSWGGGQAASSSKGGGGGAAVGTALGVSDAELGLDKDLPWSARFRISGTLEAWAPDPPSSYDEALSRQVRLTHGADRHSFLHLHAFAKHAFFAVINAARAHYASDGGLAGLRAFERQQQALGAQPYNGAHSGGVGSAGPPSAPPPSFASAVCTCIGDQGGGGGGGGSGGSGDAAPSSSGQRGSGGGNDALKGGRRLHTSVLVAMAHAPEFRVFVNGATSEGSLAAAVARIKQAANKQEYEDLSSSPLAAVLLALEDFFTAFDSSQPSLSLWGLDAMCKSCTQLPFAMAPGVHAAAQVGGASSSLLSSLPPPDLELLLLAAATLRHVARASGTGCEDEVAQICRWLARLFTGELFAKPAVEEAVMTWLWCLLRNDALYAAAVAAKGERLLRRGSAPGPPVSRQAGAWTPGEAPEECGEVPGAVTATPLDHQRQAQAMRSAAAVKRLAAKAIPGLQWYTVPPKKRSYAVVPSVPATRPPPVVQPPPPLLQPQPQPQAAAPFMPPWPGQARPQQMWVELPPAKDPKAAVRARYVHYVWL